MPRYIDAEKITFDLSGLVYILPTDMHTTGEYFMRQIRKMPVEDVRPNVRGKWIISRDNNQFYCSVCGELSDYKYRFCPDCGADLRGDSE